MPPPREPHYGRNTHVVDGGTDSGRNLPVLGRILLILLLLALVGFVLYMVWSMRGAISGTLSNVAFGVIVVAAILFYLRRRH